MSDPRFEGLISQPLQPLTDLEEQVLGDLVDGLDPRRDNPGSRRIPQAIARLRRKGYLVDSLADEPNEIGRSTIVALREAGEKNKRLAQGLDGADREWTPHERYMLFCNGFRHGAGMRAIDPSAQGLGAYDRGYAEGRAARAQAITAFANEIGYVPSILRTGAP